MERSQLSNKINDHDIKRIINDIIFIQPDFEDEIPNTYPIPFYSSWNNVSNRNSKQIYSNILFNGIRNISSLYIGIPYCNYRCAFCVYDVSVSKKKIDEYINTLVKEINIYTKINKVIFGNLKRVYIGGGTPSILTLGQLKVLFRIFNEFGDSIEGIDSFTFEFSPETVDREKLDFLINHNVNRCSLGIQDINESTLKNINRYTNIYHIEFALGLLNEIVEYFNVDLIYGLPNQSVKDWEESLNMLIKYKVPEFTLYNLRKGRKTKIKQLDLPLYEEKIRLNIANEILSESGYTQVRPFHWIRDKKIEKLWKKYKFAPYSDQHAKDGPGNELGIGTSAVSHINDTVYRNYDIFDYTTEKRLVYFDKIEHHELPIKMIYKMNDCDRFIRYLIYGVENGCIDLDGLTNIDQKIAEDFADLKNILLKYNLLLEDCNKLYLTTLGKLFYNNIEHAIVSKLKINNK